MYIAVAEGSAQSPSVYSNLLYSTMSNGSINFTFTPTQPSVELSMNLFYISTPFAPLPYMSFTLDSVSYTQQTGTSSNTQLVQISNKLKGGYRFGYNGQEKVDEIAGAGNHTTAEFWEYDTRLGRRWNRDPVVKPWESSYACFANNPIWYSDVNGDDGTKTGSGNGYMTGDLNNVVVRSSKLDPDKKDDKDDKEDDGKKSSGGGGGGAAAGGGPNSKNSVGGDQLKKYSPLLQAQGFGIADNGGGNGGEGGNRGGAQGGSSVIGYPGINIYEGNGMSGGITTPPFGIFIEQGAGTDLKQHEYGHYIQYQKMGALNYYINIALPSLYNAAENSFERAMFGKLILSVPHSHYKTETDANRNALEFFGNSIDKSFNRRFPPNTKMTPFTWSQRLGLYYMMLNPTIKL
jgi:hypothetical protein